jgi:hypothetical protein
MDFLKGVGRSLSSLVTGSKKRRRSSSKKPAAPGTPPPTPAPAAPAPPAPAPPVPPPAKGGRKMRMSNLGKLVFYKPKRKATRKGKSKGRKGRKSTRRR